MSAHSKKPGGWVNLGSAICTALLSVFFVNELRELSAALFGKSSPSLSTPHRTDSTPLHLDYRAGPQTYFRTMEATQATKVTLAKRIKAELFAMVHVGS